MADARSEYPNPRPLAQDGTAGRLWIEAGEVAPLLFAAAQTEEQRRAIRSELGLSAHAAHGLVSLADYFRITRAHAVASREESLGLAPRPLVSGTTDFVLAQASLGDTLEDAMRNMAAAYNKLHGGEYNLVEAGEVACAFRVDDASFPYTRPADASVTLMLECVLIYLHSALCAIAGADLTPVVRAVATRRREPAAHEPLQFWPCRIIYGAQCYGIEYAPEVARLPVVRRRLSEAAAHNSILSLIERREAQLCPAFAPLVRQALREGARSQEEAALRIGVSVATLRRRLTAEGHSFRRLRREHLNEAAKLGLMRAERIADVADTLGFSDPRSFTRAFKGWNGLTPRSFKLGDKSRR